MDIGEHVSPLLGPRIRAVGPELDARAPLGVILCGGMALGLLTIFIGFVEIVKPPLPVGSGITVNGSGQAGLDWPIRFQPTAPRSSSVIS